MQPALLTLLIAIAPAAEDPSTPCLADVAGQFSAMESTGSPIELPVSPQLAGYAAEAKGDHHFQGIQRLLGGEWVITGSAAADLFVIDPGGRTVREQADPSFTHAGGIQALGVYLPVGVETRGRDDGESRVVFYDLTRPMAPRRLPATIPRRPGELPQPCSGGPAPTAGAVALGRLQDGHLLLVVGRWDSDVLDFYRSETRDVDPSRFRHVASWCETATRDSEGHAARFGRYQALNLLAQCDGALFLVGFEAPDGPDLAALFRVDLRLDPPEPQVGLVKLREREFRCSGGCGFKAGAGAFVENGRLIFYSVGHRAAGRTLRLHRFDSAGATRR